MANRTREAVYFEKGGPQHTDETLRLAIGALRERRGSHLVVATGGETVMKAVKMVKASGLQETPVIGVTLQAGTWSEYGTPDWKRLDEAKRLGASILTCTHALMGNVESAISEKFGGLPPGELIAQTLYVFSQGTKVAIEIAMSAVDAGLVPAGAAVVAVAGTNSGADTAYVLRAVSTVDFFDLRVMELICKPSA